VSDADKFELLAGTYYLAAGGYDTNFYGADFEATGGAAAGYMVLNFTATIVPIILFGDYNDDGIVDAADYTVWRNHLGANVALPNEDPDQTQGSVTIEDFAVWKSHYGETTPSGGSILQQVFDVDRSIPEPTTTVLLLAGGLTLSCFLGRATFGTVRQ
jgi:hypothetical protein